MLIMVIVPKGQTIVEQPRQDPGDAGILSITRMGIASNTSQWDTGTLVFHQDGTTICGRQIITTSIITSMI